MALNHVAECARGFIEAAAALDAERFRGGNLHVIDVIAIPQRLEDSVSKSEHEQVLNRVLAQIMIDAVDLLFVENAEYDLVQLFRGGKIPSKGLFNDDAHPGIRRARARESGAAKLLDDGRINLGRSRKIKEAVAA